MDNRELLIKIINGGEARSSRLKVFSVCKGVRTQVSDEAISGDVDIHINVHCTDMAQLELQMNSQTKAILPPTGRME